MQRNGKKELIRFYLVFVFGMLILVPLLPLEATEYVSLSGLPGVDPQGGNITQYLNVIFMILISVAGLIAVVRLTLAGISYMMSDVVTTKAGAINTIQGTLLGLAIILSGTLVLLTINPNLANFNILQGTGGLQFNPVAPPPPAPTPGLNSGSGVTVRNQPCPEGRTMQRLSDGRSACVEVNSATPNPIYAPEPFPETIGAVVFSVDMTGLSSSDQVSGEAGFRETCVDWGTDDPNGGNYEVRKNNTTLSCVRVQ